MKATTEDTTNAARKQAEAAGFFISLTDVAEEACM
jgi:hypothetical protein